MSKYIFNNDTDILEFLSNLERMAFKFGEKGRKFDTDLKTDNWHRKH